MPEPGISVEDGRPATAGRGNAARANGRPAAEPGARIGAEPATSPGTEPHTGADRPAEPAADRPAGPAADRPAGAAAGGGSASGRRTGGARALRAARRQLWNLLALLLYGGVSVGLFGPWILDRMSSSFLSNQPQDGSLFVWAFNWWPFALSHHYSAVYSYGAWAPGGINLAWATTIPGPSVALQALTHSYGPMFSFNVVELAAPALAAWTAYLLCRHLTRSFFPALIGGFFFGFSPALIDEIGQGHPSLTLVFLVPVCAYLVVRLLDGSIHPLLYVPLLGIVLGLQCYVGDEILATMTLVGGLCALIAFAAGPAARRRRLLRAVPPTAGAYAIAAILALPLLHTAFTRPRIIKAIHFATIQNGASGFGDLLRYVTPGRLTVQWGSFGPEWTNNPWYLGIPLIAVLILFAVTERRRRATWMLIAGLLVILAVSLGDKLSVFGAPIMPWRPFAATPVLNIAQPGRLVTYAYLLIAVIVARWLAGSSGSPRPAPKLSPHPPSSPLWRPTPLPRRSWRLLGWLPVLLAALTILPNFTAARWVTRVPMAPFLADGAYRRYLAPGEIVWLLEVHPDRQLIWQAKTGFYFRLSGGFFGGTPQGVPEGPLQERLAMGQIGLAGRPVTVADIQRYIAVHHVGAIMASQVPWEWILKIRAAVGSRGIQQGRVRLFRLAGSVQPRGRPGAQPGPAGPAQRATGKRGSR